MKPYPKHSEDVILPGNPADAVNLVAEVIRNWNMWQYPHMVAATITTKTEHIELLEHDGIRLHTGEIHNSLAFCIIKEVEVSEDFMFSDNIMLKQLSLREFEMFLWHIASWDLRYYPSNEYRRRFPRFIIESLAFDAYWVHKELDFWKYVTPSPNCIRDFQGKVEPLLKHLSETARFSKCTSYDEVRGLLTQYHDTNKKNRSMHGK